MNRNVFTRAIFTAMCAGAAVFVTISYATMGEATSADVPAKAAAARIAHAWDDVCARDTWPNITPGCVKADDSEPVVHRQISLSQHSGDQVLVSLR
ncbi:hypothetical protein [Afifella sp. IM 167]|uniref:hypothetical protein n=1 Tax=Afifella sp. IM 167 TaxID=2033586 RepID=UPI001CC91B86|nr:hypothetical protein [Afifella sp. IM 167]MBZ8133341.1 hypothetical protein [Afifella sp. IM 167]